MFEFIYFAVLAGSHPTTKDSGFSHQPIHKDGDSIVMKGKPVKVVEVQK